MQRARRSFVSCATQYGQRLFENSEKACTVAFQVTIRLRLFWAMQARTRRAVRRCDQYPLKHALSAQQPIPQPDIGNDRLRHQMRRQPPPWQNARTVARAYTADCFT